MGQETLHDGNSFLSGLANLYPLLLSDSAVIHLIYNTHSGWYLNPLIYNTHSCSYLIWLIYNLQTPLYLILVPVSSVVIILRVEETLHNGNSFLSGSANLKYPHWLSDSALVRLIYNIHSI